MCSFLRVSSSDRSIASTYLVVEEKQPAEEAVQICGEQGEVDRRGAGFLYDHGHEAVETKHAGAKADVEQSWRERKDRWYSTASSGASVEPQWGKEDSAPPFHSHTAVFLSLHQLTFFIG